MVRKYLNWDDQAVSESIGFILILAIMISGISLVSLYGYPILLEQQANANIKNMERNMIVLQTDINSLIFKSIPYKETTMQISGGTLSVIPPNPYSTDPRVSTLATPNFTVTYYNSSAPSLSSAIYFYPGELRYEPDSQDAVIDYENGHVHKRYWNIDGSTTLSNPRWFIDDNAGSKTFVVTLVQITTGDNQKISRNGISTIQMKVEPLPLYSVDQNYGGTTQTVTIVYTPATEYDYRTAWKNYFSGLPVTVTSGTTVKLSVDVNRFVIKSYKITILGL